MVTKDDLVSKDTALKMAIEWFDMAEMDISHHAYKSALPIIQACKEALAQPVQEQGEPVAVCTVKPLQGNESTRSYEIKWMNGNPIEGWLYTTPTVAQGEPAAIVHRGVAYWIGKEQPEGTKLYTAPVIEQVEPFGYFKAEPFGWIDCASDDEFAVALYEAPPQRQWVGLSNDEIQKKYLSIQSHRYVEFAKAIEAKLKELNT